MNEKYSSQTDDEENPPLIDVKDWILDKGPLRSPTKCSLCKKGAVFIPKEEGLPYYCEDHAPWRE